MSKDIPLHLKRLPTVTTTLLSLRMNSVHSLREFVCDWNGLTGSCCILYVSSLHSQFTTFNPHFLIEKVHESDKEVQDSPSRRALPQMQAETLDRNSAGRKLVQQLSESSDDSEI